MANAIMENEMSRKNKMIALVDMDGTLCDHNGAFDRHLEKLNAIFNPEEKITRRNCPDYLKDLIRNQPGFWANLEPIRLGMDIYKMLEDMDFCMTILTKGPKGSINAWSEKFQWCIDHLNHTNVTITQDKGNVYGKLLVDDYPKYIKSWLEWRPRGLVLMPHHDYNEDFDHPQVMRVHDDTPLEAIRERVQELVDRVQAQLTN